VASHLNEQPGFVLDFGMLDAFEFMPAFCLQIITFADWQQMDCIMVQTWCLQQLILTAIPKYAHARYYYIYALLVPIPNITGLDIQVFSLRLTIGSNQVPSVQLKCTVEM